MKKIKFEDFLRIENEYHSYLTDFQSIIDTNNFCDINVNQLIIILKLNKDTMRINDIQKLHKIKTNISYNTSALLKKGYLSQEDVPFDKRVKMCKLTEKGRKLCKICSI